MDSKLEFRMYEGRYPEVNTAVMTKIKKETRSTAKVSLVEYNNMEGMIFWKGPSRHWNRIIGSLIGNIEPMMVLSVDEEKGHIDLSMHKNKISTEDVQACKERYNKSKFVHSIMRHVAETFNIDLEELYLHIGWPLYRKYGHAFEAFKLVVTDPDSVFSTLTHEIKEVGPHGQEVTKLVPALSQEVKDFLVSIVRRRMPTVQPSKIRADIEMKCFQFDGVLHIKEAMRKAEAAGNNDCLVKIKLFAAPRYVLTTQTLDKEQGILVLNKAIAFCTESIEQHQGQLEVKEAPRVVSEPEDKLLGEHMADKVSGDEGSEEEEDTGIGEFDVDNGSTISE